MRAQEFLKQIQKIDRMIANKSAEIEQWETIATSTTAPMNGDRVQTSSSQQKMADAVIECISIKDELRVEIERLKQARNEVVRVIEQLPVSQYDLLHKVYIQNLTFRQIADMLGKTRSSIGNMHKKAVRNVQAILDRREDEQRKRNERI